MFGERSDRAGLHVARRAQVERDPPTDELVHHRPARHRPRAVRDAIRVQRQRSLHQAAVVDQFAGMHRQPQPACACDLERRGMHGGVGVASLVAGEVEAGDASVAERNRGARHLDVLLRRGRSPCHHAQTRLHTASTSGGLRTGGDGVDHLVQRQPLLEVEPGRPLQLHEPHAVGCLVLHQLRGHPLQRVAVLHDRDRQIERAQQVLLRPGVRGRDQRVEHSVPRRRRLDAVATTQLDRRVRPQRPIEVQVQLRLRHRLQETANGAGGLGHVGSLSGPRLRFPPP